MSFKTFSNESDFENVTLEVTSMKSAPPAMPKFFSKAPKSAKKTIETDFLLIREKEFCNLFDNPVVKAQKMSKFFDEQDFNSDVETIEGNKIEILKNFEKAIARYCKSDPTKIIANFKEPANEIDVASLE